MIIITLELTCLLSVKRHVENAYGNVKIELDKGIGCPAEAVEERSEREEEWHELHTFCLDHQFLHHAQKATNSLRNQPKNLCFLFTF